METLIPITFIALICTLLYCVANIDSEEGYDGARFLLIVLIVSLFIEYYFLDNQTNKEKTTETKTEQKQEKEILYKKVDSTFVPYDTININNYQFNTF